MRRKERERDMRGRARDRADEEARHHADARDQPPGHEGAAKRDPEAEDLCDGRDVGVREALVLEERHRHRARDVARHAEARDEQQDRGRHRAEPLEEVVDRRPDRLDEAGMRLVGLHVGGRFGRE